MHSEWKHAWLILPRSASLCEVYDCPGGCTSGLVAQDNRQQSHVHLLVVVASQKEQDVLADLPLPHGLKGNGQKH